MRIIAQWQTTETHKRKKDYSKMTQSFLQPKGMLKPQIGIEDLTKQYAQIFSKPQAQEQTESTNPMRQTLNDYFTKIMANQITMPKYTTLSDVLGANKGDKLGVFAESSKLA